MGTKRILVVEDEPDLKEALEEHLSNKGFSVDGVGTAEDALEFVKKSPPDLILLDTILPGMSGIDFLEAVKDIRASHKIAVIMLSNLDNPGDLEKARAYDIEEYLVKTDWRLDDVIEKIRKALH